MKILGLIPSTSKANNKPKGGGKWWGRGGGSGGQTQIYLESFYLGSLSSRKGFFGKHKAAPLLHGILTELRKNQHQESLGGSL